MNFPQIHLKKSYQERALAGHPWIFSNEIENFAQAKNYPSGELVQINLQDNKPFALGYFNPSSLISVRILSYDLAQKINQDFFVDRFNSARLLREKMYDSPYYRLVHSEGDFLPGLVIERFNNLFVCQISTAGMENLREFLLGALRKIFSDSKIVFKNNSESRKLENLSLEPSFEGDEIDEKISVKEGEIEFLIDVKNGQKTGWFFDQKPNREFVGQLVSRLVLQSKADEKISILDCFSYVGGFGINALAAGASEVCFIDSSSQALELTKENCNKLFASQFYQDSNPKNSSPKLEFLEGKVFDELEKIIAKNQQFDIVILDPPAFIKSKKDLFAGLRGYEKLLKLAAQIVKSGGFLMLSSCSHHAKISDLLASAAKSLHKSGRQSHLIRSSGAGFDHPINPSLPENDYLKSLTFQII